MKFAAFLSLVALAPLAACGGAAVQGTRPAVAAPAAPAGEEISFGRFVAPVPTGFAAGKSKTDPVVIMQRGGSAIIFAREESERAPTDPEGCQKYAHGATAEIIAAVAGEPLEVEVQRVGAVDAQANATPGCWVSSVEKAHESMKYMSSVLHFAAADVFVMCMSTGTASDATACGTVLTGMREGGAR
jgi:hypothetical protein